MDLCGTQVPFVRRSHAEPVRMVHTTRHRPFLQRVMFWGAICGEGPVALVPINGTMTAPKYVAALEEYLLPYLDEQPLSQQYLFQHDNAPSHKAQRTLAFLETNAVEVLQDWPPYSPDLNIIENMWAFIKRKLRQENITTRQQLQTRVLDIWASPDIKEMCCRLASSMPKRIALCIRNKGGFVKY